MKELILKFWKPVAPILAAVLAIFIYRTAKSSEKDVAEKIDTKAQVDQAVEALRPKTEEAVSAIEEVNKSTVPHREDPIKDLSQIVEDYNKL